MCDFIKQKNIRLVDLDLTCVLTLMLNVFYCSIRLYFKIHILSEMVLTFINIKFEYMLSINILFCIIANAKQKSLSVEAFLLT